MGILRAEKIFGSTSLKKESGMVLGILTAFLGVFAIQCALALATLWMGASKGIESPHSRVLYFLNYQDGFMRRALPGELVSRVPLAYRDATINAFAGILAILVCTVLVVLAIAISQRAPSREYAITTFTVVVISPIYISTFVRDLGRFDGIGVVCGAMVVVVMVRRSVVPWLAVAVAMLALAVATACEEFLIAYLAPVFVAAVVVRYKDTPGFSWLRCAALALLTMAPSLVVFIQSLRVQPTASVMSAVADRSGLTGEEDRAFGGPLWAITQSFDSAREFVASMPDHGRTTILYVVLFAVSMVTLTRLLNLGWRLLVPAAYLSVLSLGLGLVAVDVRRWWTLALVTMVALIALLAGEAQSKTTAHGSAKGELIAAKGGLIVPSSARVSITFVFVGVCLAVSILSQGGPLYGGQFSGWMISLMQTFP